MLVDVAALLGTYPYRRVPPRDPAWLLTQMDRLGVDEAWVGDAGAFLLEDPGAANRDLASRLAGHDRLAPVRALYRPHLCRRYLQVSRHGPPSSPYARIRSVRPARAETSG